MHTGEDLAINIWDIGSGKRIKKMTGHTAAIYSLSFSAESSLLVSGGADWSVRCWDVKSSGGYAGKAKGNATTQVSMGLASDGASASRDFEEEGLETSVLPYFLCGAFY
jgi:transcription initiation factor TFIID subunit 5